MNVTLLLSGDAWEGAPIASITVDGVPMPSVTVVARHGGPAQSVNLDLTPGEHTIVVALANDAWGGSADRDRNLYLDAVLLNGLDAGVAPYSMFTTSPHEFQLTVPASPVSGLPAVLDGLRVLVRQVEAIVGAPVPVPVGPVAPPPVAPPPSSVVVPPVVPPAPSTHPGSTITVTPAEWDSEGMKLVTNRHLYDPAVISLKPGTYHAAMALGVGAMPERYDSPFTSITVSAETPVWPPNVVFAGGDRQWSKAAFVACAGLKGPGPVVTLTLIGMSIRDVLKGQSDGTAGIYGDMNSRLVLRGMDVSNCNNGLFAQQACLSVLVEDSTFGLFGGNGCSGGDGGSHNQYNNAAEATMRRIICAPLKYPGNTLKFRSRGKVYVGQSALFSSDGRFVDRPNAGETLIEDCLLVQMPASTSDQMFAMGEEGELYNHDFTTGRDMGSNVVSGRPETALMIYRNCDIWITSYAAIMVSAPCIMRFEGCRWHFIRQAIPGEHETVLTVAVSGITHTSGTIEGLPFPLVTDRWGQTTMPIPDDAWETGPAPAMPTSPYDLPTLLARHLPARP